jgi:hypothetical protein
MACAGVDAGLVELIPGLRGVSHSLPRTLSLQAGNAWLLGTVLLIIGRLAFHVAYPRLDVAGAGPTARRAGVRWMSGGPEAMAAAIYVDEVGVCLAWLLWLSAMIALLVVGIRLFMRTKAWDFAYLAAGAALHLLGMACVAAGALHHLRPLWLPGRCFPLPR